MGVRVINMRALGISVAATLIVGVLSEAAVAANWLEKSIYLWGPRYDNKVPECTNWWALNTIRSRFSTKEGRFWNSSLSITEFDQIREVAYRPWADGTIPRRFCEGRAQTSDGVWRKLRYSIVEDGGVIGATFGVQWCVVGTDRNWAYNPDCRAAGE